MANTTVVNCQKEPCDVYIGRCSLWGNPYSHKSSRFAVTVVATRKEAIRKYREYILARPDLLERLPDLKGKRLGCFCKPLACHGDVLVELVEAL